jgi:hypothetical protein
MEKVLLKLLQDLETIEEEHEEIGDTAVREAMTAAIHDGFIKPKAGFVLGEEFEMFTAKGNQRVKAALTRFLKRAEAVAQKEGLVKPRARLDAFQNLEVQTAEGNVYADYFGFAEKP